MNRTVKITASASAVVAVIVVASALGSAAIIPNPVPAPDLSIKNLKATPNHVDKNIKVEWDAVSSTSLVTVSGYRVQYWQGSASPTIAYTTTNSWTHSNPTVDVTYKYRVSTDVSSGFDGPFSDAVSATVRTLPSVSSGTFDESTNTVTLTATQSLQGANATNVCVHNTIQVAENTYEWLDRCGSSATVSGSTATISIVGEYGNFTMTSESIIVGINAIQNTNGLWNAIAKEISLHP